MTIRPATLADAKRIAEVAEPLRMGTEEEFAAAINRADAVWVINDDGGWCQVERKPRHQTISVGPLLPIDMGDELAMALLKECVARAYRKFPDERGWRIVTYIPAENRSAADSFQAWFRCERIDLPAGDVRLWLPSLTVAYDRSQRWQTQ